jgi:phosphonopyruvate decarboxylase
MLDTMGIKYLILTDNYQEEIKTALNYMKNESKSFAIIIKKNIFSKFSLDEDNNPYTLTRELALELLLSKIDRNSLIVSTTGKTSREVFELREKNSDTHERDFLTVGSMGHTSAIALGLALSTPKKVYCIDGDGSLLMHLGGLGITAKNAKDNFKYIVINNGSHESVGGQPTIGFDLDLNSILTGLGFSKVFEVSTVNEIENIFNEFDNLSKSVLIINVKQGSRDDLGRPTTTPQQNKEAFMKFIQEKE